MKREVALKVSGKFPWRMSDSRNRAAESPYTSKEEFIHCLSKALAVDACVPGW